MDLVKKSKRLIGTTSSEEDRFLELLTLMIATGMMAVLALIVGAICN